MDIASLVARVANELETFSHTILEVADTASESIDKVTEFLEDVHERLPKSNEQKAREYMDASAEAQDGPVDEEPTPEYMYEYLKQKSPRMYDHPGTKRLLLENGARGHARLYDLYEAVLLQEKVQRDRRAGSSWGEVQF